MPNVPGTFHGTRYKDLRVLILPSIKKHYVDNGTWKDIVGYRSYEQLEVITVKIPGGRRKDKWKRTEGLYTFHPWYIADDEFVWDYTK